MLHDLTHSALPASVGLIFGAGSLLGVLDHPVVASIVAGVAVSLIVAHVLAVMRLFRRVDKAESVIERLLLDRERTEARQERVATELLKTLERMDGRLDTQDKQVHTMTEKVERGEKEIDTLRLFRHDVEKSYRVTVSVFTRLTEQIDQLMAKLK